MEITDLRVHPIAADVAQPSWTAQEYKERATRTVFEVHTDEGITGYGDVQSGPQELVCEYADTFGDVVEGMDPIGHVEVWETLLSATHPRPGGIGGWDGLPAPLSRDHRAQIMAAIAGIDIALWDIKGKAAGMPVYRLLGGTETELFTYATGGYYVDGHGPADYAEEMAGFVADGYDAVKMKTGALSIEEEAKRVRLAREAIGPEPLLMLDLNAPYGIEECVEFAEAVEPYDVYWLEEPLYWYLQPADFVRLADEISIPLAHGEREWHRFTIRDFIDSGAIRFVQFDSTRYGGFTESLRIAHYAEQAGVSIAPHTAPHFHAHLVSAFGDAAFAVESHGNTVRNPMEHAIYNGGVSVEDGRVHLPDDPGFGVSIDWDRIEEWRVDPE